jgi:tetratricopeptide (TPR) repeat protein
LSTSVRADETAAKVTDSDPNLSFTPNDESASNDGQNLEGAPEHVRNFAIQAIDEYIEISKQMGGTTQVAQWRIYREQLSTGDINERSIEVGRRLCQSVQLLRQRNELRSAKQMVPHVLQLAKAVKDQDPSLFMFAHIEAAAVDIGFERYDSALEHMQIALGIATKADVNWRESLDCQFYYAILLRKLNRFDEAEQIYSKLIREANARSNELSKDELYRLILNRAVAYAENGEFEKFQKALPDSSRKHINADGNQDRDGDLCKVTAYINWELQQAKHLEFVAAGAQILVDSTQEIYGVSSRQHIEAIELLAKVRANQSQYDDAADLLKKSIELRAVLLGADHPSIVQLQNEIEMARKMQQSKIEMSSVPVDFDTALKPLDQFGNTDSVDVLRK